MNHIFRGFILFLLTNFLVPVSWLILQSLELVLSFITWFYFSFNSWGQEIKTKIMDIWKLIVKCIPIECQNQLKIRDYMEKELPRQFVFNLWFAFSILSLPSLVFRLYCAKILLSIQLHNAEHIRLSTENTQYTFIFIVLHYLST